VFAREYDRLCTGPNTQLVENVRYVIADRLFADLKPFRDVDVAQAVLHQRQHLALALRQCREYGISCRRRWPQKRENGLAKPLPRGFVFEQNVIA
jgi:hypothetical protein